MQIWNYHPDTGELVGTGTADAHPIEAGNWLVPAHATAKAPGVAPKPGRVYQFLFGAWADVPDCRGETWWKADAESNTDPVIVDFIGDPAHRGLTNVEPSTPPAVVWPVEPTARQLFTALATAIGKSPEEIEALVEVAKTL